MKQIWYAILTMMLVVILFTGCKTATHTSVESRTHNVERQREAVTDSVSLNSSDTVFVMVDRGDSIVRIVERTTHWRERVKVQKDTVVVYVQNDTIRKVESVKEKTKRSPPRWKLSLLTLTLMAALVVAAVLTIKKG